MAFEQTVKNPGNSLRTDKGCTSEFDYVEQTSWKNVSTNRNNLPPLLTYPAMTKT